MLLIWEALMIKVLRNARAFSSLSQWFEYLIDMYPRNDLILQYYTFR